MKKTIKQRKNLGNSPNIHDFKATVNNNNHNNIKRQQKIHSFCMPNFLSTQSIITSMLREINKANIIIDQVRNYFYGDGDGGRQVKMMGASQKNVEVLDFCRGIEYQIRGKQASIKEIQDDIKQLEKGIKRTEQLDFGKEIQIIAQELQQSLEIHRKKFQFLSKQKSKIQKIENKYATVCLKSGIEFITFDKFRKMYHNKTTKNLIQTISTSTRIKTQHENRSRNYSTKQLREKDYNIHEELQKNKVAIGMSKKLHEVSSHREVVEAALRAAKKRHEHQMGEYRSKLEFLHDENQMLEEKQKIKIRELQEAYIKFKESRAEGRLQDARGKSKIIKQILKSDRVMRLITDEK